MLVTVPEGFCHQGFACLKKHRPDHRFKGLADIPVTSQWELCYQVLDEKLKGHSLPTPNFDGSVQKFSKN